LRPCRSSPAGTCGLGRVTTAVSINPLQLMEQVIELPVEQVDDLSNTH
jgi:hypothetical protein